MERSFTGGAVVEVETGNVLRFYVQISVEKQERGSEAGGSVGRRFSLTA
jgi:hypothetical protein